MQLLLLLLFYHSAEVQHLKIVNESYGKHLLFTVKLSSILLLLAGCAILHGLLPFILTGTVSDKIKHQKRFNAFKYSDWALGQFMEKCKSDKFYEKTIFIILGDHGFISLSE